MPTEVEAPVQETEEREFGTPLEDIFEKAMPLEKEEPPKKEEKPESNKVEKKIEPKKEEKKEEVKPDLMDIISSAKPREEIKSEEEIKKDPVPETIKGKAAENFDKIATDKQQALIKARTLEKEVIELREKVKSGDPGTKSRLELLQQQNKDLSERLGRAGLELHPWFEQNITAPRKSAQDTALKAFETAGGDPNALKTALRLDGKAKAERLDELFSEITSTTLRGKVERAVDAIEALDLRKDQVLANRDRVMQDLQKQDQVYQAKFFETHEQTTKENLTEAKKFLLDKHGIFVFKNIDDPQYSWWNEENKKIDEAAESLMLKTTDPKEMAIAAYLAAGMPRVFAILSEEVKARKKLQEQLSRLEGSEPRLGKGERKPAKEATEEEGEGESLASHILGSIKNAQAEG